MVRTLVGTRIREGRRAKGLTQAALASNAGISAPYLNLIEHNRRGIAGKTLSAIAEALDISVRDLSEGADQTLLDKLLEASKSEPAVSAELQRLEEFVGRFPGWARLLKRLQDRADHHEEELAALSDRMNRDPFFSEAMHLMLSNITALRSTVEILTDGSELPAAMAARFMGNLRDQVGQLSDTAAEITAHFDAQSQATSPADDRSPAETFWMTREFHDPELEKTSAPAVQTSDPRLKRDLEDYATMAEAISVDDVLEIAPEHRYDPLSIAAATGQPLNTVFRRLAHLPPSNDRPEFGLMICDQAGGVLFRKPLSSLSLPRRSGGCPLWPLYRAAQRPNQPIRAIMSMPSGEDLLTYSIASVEGPMDFDLPARMTLSMLFTPDIAELTEKAERQALPTVEVGAQCSICPRADCLARRDAFILE